MSATVLTEHESAVVDAVALLVPCGHHTCAVVASIHSGGLTRVVLLDAVGPVGPFIRVMADGLNLGSIRPPRELFPVWVAFGGGNHLGDAATLGESVKLVTRNADNASFAFRLALH